MKNRPDRILLIEDEGVQRTLILWLLRTAGIPPKDCLSAETLRQGLKVLSDFAPSLVLLDLNLPDSCGLDTLVTVRRHAATVPIVVLTCDDDEDQAILALQRGAQDYLIKDDVDGRLLLRSIDYSIARQRIETSLRYERDFAEGLIESVQAVILLLDTSGIVLRANAFAAERTGVDPDAVLGQHWFSQCIPPSDQPAMERLLHRAISNHGTTFDIGSLITARGQICAIEWAARAIRDAHGNIAYVLLTGHDVTQLKQAQQRALDAERLATIGQMITGLAHESRNALQRIQACLTMLMRVIADRPQAMDYARRLQRAQDQLQHVFEQVRSYAAPIRLDPVVSDLRELIAETWNELTSVTRHKQLQLELRPTTLNLHCEVDRFRMQQVCRNILENSISACADPVHVTVEWYELEMDHSPALQVTFEDNGPGFTAEQRERLFAPFYTTKTTGTGLGLSIAKRIVERHGGRIEIGDSSGDGARTTITLRRTRK